MTFEEFDKQCFSPGMKCRYEGEIFRIVGVDFRERLIGLSGVSGPTHWRLLKGGSK